MLKVSFPNGFDGAWNPICPTCGGYMHTGHEDDCPVVLRRERELARLVETMRRLRENKTEAT